MDIILHLGAHRTATTSFQSYLRRHRDELAECGVGFWGPRRTRGGLFAGVLPQPGPYSGPDAAKRAAGRIALHLERSQSAGLSSLVISDENMLGSIRDCLRRGLLYQAVGQRMSHFAAAFGGRVTRVVLTVRSLDLWWASAAAYGVARGTPLHDPAKWVNIAASSRGWRDVITDIACAMPETEIRVLPFEQFANRPDLLLSCAAGCQAPHDSSDEQLNRAPDLDRLRALVAERGDRVERLPKRETGRWPPFKPVERAALKELYADDLHWLTAGADGLAQLTEDTERQKTEIDPRRRPRKTKNRGRSDAIEERPVA